jgi:hypothetical protein
MTSSRVRALLNALLFALVILGAAFPALAQEDGGADPMVITKGRISYQLYCRSCHGNQAKGDGSAADILTVPPPDLTTISARNGGEFPAEEVHRTIDGRKAVKGHGRDMPFWGDAFKLTEETEDEEAIKAKIHALVEFLRSLQVEG